MDAMLQLTFWLSFVLATASIPNAGSVTVSWSSARSQLTGAPALLVERKAASADTLKTDPETGLALDEKLMVVKAHCTSCHSPKLIMQNRFTRDGWKEKIRWMQRTQKLWDLGESEPAVLDYLTKHYGPETKAFDGRRMPLKNVKWYELN